MSKRRSLEFIVPGRPVPKVRMTRQGRYTDRAQKCLGYQSRVRELAWVAALQQGWQMPDGPVTISIRFSIGKGPYPDIDNLAKSVLDGLQPDPRQQSNRSGVIADDNAQHIDGLDLTVQTGVPEDQQQVAIRIWKPRER